MSHVYSYLASQLAGERQRGLLAQARAAARGAAGRTAGQGIAACQAGQTADRQGSALGTRAMTSPPVSRPRIYRRRECGPLASPTQLLPSRGAPDVAHEAADSTAEARGRSRLDLHFAARRLHGRRRVRTDTWHRCRSSHRRSAAGPETLARPESRVISMTTSQPQPRQLLRAGVPFLWRTVRLLARLLRDLHREQLTCGRSSGRPAERQQAEDRPAGMGPGA
jgi:hypothetical protein